jgi:hypothetical protein
MYSKTFSQLIARPSKYLVVLQPVRMASSDLAAAKSSKTTNELSKEEKYTKLKNMAVRPLYLDAQATSPTDPRVLDAMLPYMTNLYGNPHSRTHAYGWESEKAVEKAREVGYLSKKREQILLNSF